MNVAAVTFGDVLFWLSNLAIVAGYMVAAAYFRSAPKADVRTPQRRAGIAFFFFCALTHVELAVHGLTGTPLVTPNVSWHMILIHVPQGVSIWVMVLGIAHHGLYLRPVRPPEDGLPPVDRRHAESP